MYSDACFPQREARVTCRLDCNRPAPAAHFPKNRTQPAPQRADTPCSQAQGPLARRPSMRRDVVSTLVVILVVVVGCAEGAPGDALFVESQDAGEPDGASVDAYEFTEANVAADG